MVALVASIGSVFLFQGMDVINGFNNLASSFLGGQTDAARERFLIEHIHYNTTTPVDKELNIWIRNTGIVEARINSITMVKLDTQELIISEVNRNDLIPIKSMLKITLNNTQVDLSAGPTQVWTDPYFSNSKEYRFTVTTTLGNSFDVVTSPFNT